MADDGVEQGGCRWTDLRPDLLGGGPVGHAVWVGDVGFDLPHWEFFGQITSQGDPKAHREATLARKVWRMGIPPSGFRNGRGDTSVSEDVRLPPPEQSCTVYCNQAHCGTVTGSGAYTRFKDNIAVEGAGWIGREKDADGGSEAEKRRRRQTKSLVGYFITRNLSFGA